MTTSLRVCIRTRRVLPTEDLLDNFPPVLGKPAEFLLAPEEEKITAQKLVGGSDAGDRQDPPAAGL